MSQPNEARVGAVSSFVVGVTYLVAAGCHLASPPDGRASAGPAKFWPSVAAQGAYVNVLDVALVIGALFALAAVPAISARARQSGGGWLSWARSVGLLGFAAAALTDATSLGRTGLVAAAYAAADAPVRAAISAEPIFPLDAHGILGFAAIGLWMLVVNAVAWREGAFPRWVSAVGLVAGAGFFFVTAGFTLANDALVSVGAVLSGVLLGPIWYVAMAFVLRGPSPVVARTGAAVLS